jgi:hypothetical protein
MMNDERIKIRRRARSRENAKEDAKNQPEFSSSRLSLAFADALSSESPIAVALWSLGNNAGKLKPLLAAIPFNGT